MHMCLTGFVLGELNPTYPLRKFEGGQRVLRAGRVRKKSVVRDLGSSCIPTTVQKMDSHVPPTPRTELYLPTFLDDALEVFPEQTLWLLLSLDHYSWRAHADTAFLLLGTVKTGDADPALHHLDHRLLAGVEELFLVLDQLWRIIAGIRAHRAGNDFLEAYCVKDSNMEAKFRDLKALGEAEWKELLYVPDDATIQSELLNHGGTKDEIERLQAKAHAVVSLAPLNVHEILDFFESPGSSVSGQQGYGIRTMINKYRHGTRVLYEDCSPTTAGWTVTNPVDGRGPTSPLSDLGPEARKDTTNVLIQPPDSDGRAYVGSIGLDEAMRGSIVDSVATLSLWLKRLVRAFLTAEPLRQSWCLASLEDYEWKPMPRRRHSPTSTFRAGIRFLLRRFALLMTKSSQQLRPLPAETSDVPNDEATTPE